MEKLDDLFKVKNIKFNAFLITQKIQKKNSNQRQEDRKAPT